MAESVDSYDSRSDVVEWTCHHFSVSHKGNDVAALMESVASSLRQLAPVDVLDITFFESFENNTENITMTVYFDFEGPAPEAASKPIE